jgi:hypothetical protein
MKKRIITFVVIVSLSVLCIGELFIPKEHVINNCEGGWKIKEQRYLICLGTKKVMYSNFDFLYDRISFQFSFGEYRK